MNQQELVASAARHGRDKECNAIIAVLREFDRATAKFGAFNSPHEGYAVLLEEVDELWDEVKANDQYRATVEAIQVAAMALRFLVDCGATTALVEKAATE